MIDKQITDSHQAPKRCLLSTNPSPPDDSIYVYEYEPDTDKTKGLVDVFLWEEASSISIHEDKLYLTLEESVFITDPYWCSFYGRVSHKC